MKYLFSLLLLFSVFTIQAQVAQSANQCSALTTKGVQCKNKAVESDGKCKIHSDNTPRCNQLTKSGKPCKMVVKNPGDKCHNHKQ